MKSSNELTQKREYLKELFASAEFDLEFESKMVQSRILSPIIEFIESNNITQSKLAELSGIKQPLLNSILNTRKNLSMNHLAKIQHALGFILQPPRIISKERHWNKYYSSDRMLEIDIQDYMQELFGESYHDSKNIYGIFFENLSKILHDKKSVPSPPARSKALSSYSSSVKRKF